jgi:hypothetical protein
MKNQIFALMGRRTFTSKDFNYKLNETLEHGWNSKVTLDFLYVAESLGIVKCLGTIYGNQYSWAIIDEDQEDKD